MFLISRKTLKILAALVWVFGGTLLMIKGYTLLKSASLIYFDMVIISMVLISSFIIGQIKSKYIFEKFCIKNLKRIKRIKEPKIYQIFELKFFLFLILMVFTGVMLSKLAEDNYVFLLGVGMLDLALSTALLNSSTIFFKKSNS